jgi:DNA-binding transcriptional MerR regulator
MVKEVEKIHWTHTEVADMLNEPTSKIRFWMQEFGIEHQKGKILRYNKDAVEKFKKIQALVNEGYKLKFIKTKI